MLMRWRAGQNDRRAGHVAVELGEGDDRAGEGDRADGGAERHFDQRLGFDATFSQRDMKWLGWIQPQSVILARTGGRNQRLFGKILGRLGTLAVRLWVAPRSTESANNLLARRLGKTVESWDNQDLLDNISVSFPS